MRQIRQGILGLRRPARLLQAGALPAGMVCLAVIPADAVMYCINHWIPAFAGMTMGEELVLW